MDHHGVGCEHHAKQEDRETFDCLMEIKKLIKAKLALPPFEEMWMTFLGNNCHPPTHCNIERRGEKIYSSSLPKVLSLAKDGKLKDLKKLISKDGVKSASVKAKDGRTVLHFAACGGHSRICKFLIYDLQFDVNTKDSWGCTPLHEAASWNHLDTLRDLIDYGANPLARTTMGLTALHFSVDGGETGDLIDYLISRGIDVNATSGFGTPLWIAAIQNQQEAMQKLLRLGANPNISPRGMLSPLHASILNCSLKCVDTLLSAGADQNIKSCGVSPLEAAFKCGDRMIGQLLLEKGAFSENVMDDVQIKAKAEEVYLLYKSVGQKAYRAGKYLTSFVWYKKEAVARLEEIRNYNNSELNLPSFEEIRMLIRAKLAVFHISNLSHLIPDRSTANNILVEVSHGDIKKFSRLISELHSEGVNLLFDVKSPVGETALHFAAGMGHIDICEYLLLQFKFDINIKDSRGCTPLHTAAIRNQTKTISFLIGRGVDLKARTFDGETALHLAAEAGSLDVMYLLISEGFDVNVTTDFGTPLRSAAIHNQEEAMRILLNNGAKPNEFPQGTYSPLCDAIVHTSYNCVEQLLLAKADPNMKSFEATPLELAILYGNKRILGLLLEQGANANERDVYDLTPLELAVLEGDEEMVKILFPETLPIPNIKDWSVDGVKRHYEDEKAKEQIRVKAKSAYSLYDSKGQEAHKAGRYQEASDWYSEGIDTNVCDQACVYLKRSLCFLQLNQNISAMNDALKCLFLEGESKSAATLFTYGLGMFLCKEFERGARHIEEACDKLQSDLGIVACCIYGPAIDLELPVVSPEFHSEN